MEWVVILNLILELISNCRKQSSEELLFRRLRNPGLREQLALRQHFHQAGLRGVELRDKVQESMRELANATDEEIRTLILQSKD